MGLYDGMGFFEKIAFTIAIPIMTPFAVAKEVYDLVTYNEGTSEEDYERNLKEENEKAEEDARNLALQQQEAREREKTALVLRNAKNLAVSFLNEYYRKNQQLSEFLSTINQQGTPYSVKSKLLEIVGANFCDDVVFLTNDMKNKKFEISQLDAALIDIKKLKSNI